MADKLTESKRLRSQMKRLIQEVVKEETRACFRVYKAVVVIAPNGTSCGVRLVGEQSELTLPYSSKVASVAVGDIVWVATIFGTLSNAIVWETADFK